MAKKYKMRERPGILLYFDALPTLYKLSEAAQGKFLVACLEYWKMHREPNFQVEDVREQVRLETLWEQTKPRIDSDGEGWKDGIIQRKYAGYCSGCERTGDIPMQYESYREWYLTREERESELSLTVVDEC